MPFTLISIAVVFLVAVAILFVRRGVRSDALDLGAVSTRWLSELRRDEPWTR
jgi:hypothetical protein